MNIQRLSRVLHAKVQYKDRIARIATQQLTDFPEKFDLKAVAQSQYNLWEKNNYFPHANSEKETIRMLLPPPNITGTLHLGHAMDTTVQDVLARWFRMQGYPVVWIPGMDHAGIATELIVRRQLVRNEGKEKLMVKKEELIPRIWEWKSEKEETIRQQLKDLGATLNWNKEYFTMSQEMHNSVLEAFIALHNKKLLYRREGFVNWCPTLKSSISELEVEYTFVERETKFNIPGYKNSVSFGIIAEVSFPIEGSNEKISIATTRPETLFGDVALAVNPTDERYSKYIGCNAWHELRQKHIPIVAHPLVEKDFGTGVVKVTPAHDPTDFEIAKAFDLELIEVIDESGNLTEACGNYKGLPRYIARDMVLDELKTKGFLESIKDHKMAVPRCSRSGDIIENMIKKQWFVNCKPMAEKAIDAVKSNQLKIDPFEKVELWYHWLENIKDWNVSRQISWGHRIPAFEIRDGNNSEWIVARSENEARAIAEKKYGNSVSELQQDSDVLDTWFSSGILPLSTAGWPRSDYTKDYPLTLMITGHDIFLPWVARMVMLGLELTGDLPFREIMLHGIVCDSRGRKMSKTIGNVILPENVINGISLEELNKQVSLTSSVGSDQKSDTKRILAANKEMFPQGIPACGTDALRFYLCSTSIKNATINFDIKQCNADKAFCNKIWQVARYVLMQTRGAKFERSTQLNIADRWILSRLAFMVETVNTALENRQFRSVVLAVKEFFYYEFCDYYVEVTKWGFKENDTDIQNSHRNTLIECLEVSLRICAPLMPYITEDLYKRLSSELPGFRSVSSLLEASYPLAEQFKEWRNESLDEKVAELISLTEVIRSLSAGVKKDTIQDVRITTNNSDDCNFYQENLNILKAGSKIFNVSVASTAEEYEDKNIISYDNAPGHLITFKTESDASLKRIQANITRKKGELSKSLAKANA